MEILLMRLLFSFLTVMFVLGVSAAFAPPALAVNCDVNACINICTKRCATPGCACSSSCLQTIEARKKKGQCK
jgi:hypothetical protein